MPKSKREKQISLTRTQKKGLELKQDVIKKVQAAADNYARLFVVRVENMRNNKLKEVREEWHRSKFFFGKNKVMAFALGSCQLLSLGRGEVCSRCAVYLALFWALS